MTKTIEYELSNGNIFSDLEIDCPSELLAKAKLASTILAVIEQRKLTQLQAAKLLNVDRSYISKLKRGSELKKFTFDRLLSWLNKLDQDVTLQISKKAKHQKSAMINVAI